MATKTKNETQIRVKSKLPIGVKLERGRVYDVHYRCDTPGPDVYEGVYTAYWTGEIDYVGKLTFVVVDNMAYAEQEDSSLYVEPGQSVYLFRREITNLEPV